MIKQSSSRRTRFTEKPEECAFCNWETKALTECDAYARVPGAGPFTPEDKKERAWLCEVCRHTYAGNVYLYPRQYSEDARVLGSILAWGINAILDAVSKAKDLK